MTDVVDSPVKISRINPKLLSAVQAMSEDEKDRMNRILTPRIVEPYFVHNPHPVQRFALCLNSKELLFGGAAGGGKSDWLLMAALQYVDVPHYSALILRKTWPDLNAPGAILDRAKTWFANLPVKKADEGRYWTFPSGATLQFGTLQYDKDVSKYMSAEYQFVGFDELTHWREEPYRFMFSRIRKPQIQCLSCSGALQRRKRRNGMIEFVHTNASKAVCKRVAPDPRPLNQYSAAPDGTTLFDVPLRMRAASNPGSIGHIWVRDRFINPETRDKNAIFIPSLVSDNPSLNQKEYEETLMNLTPVARERMLNGDWDVAEEGGLFLREDFQYAPAIAEPTIGRVRFWDMAATENKSSDYTSGALVSIGKSGRWYIEHIVRGRWNPVKVEQIIKQTHETDGRDVKVRMEQEPGSAGVNVISHYRRNVIPSANFDGVRPSGSKTVRASTFSTQVAGGNVTLIEGQWCKDFLDEAQLFPQGEHDDQIDSVTGGFDVLNFGRKTRILV